MHMVAADARHGLDMEPDGRPSWRRAAGQTVDRGACLASIMALAWRCSWIMRTRTMPLANWPPVLVSLPSCRPTRSAASCGNMTRSRRNQIERLFRRIKDWRRVFTRYDKLDMMFAAFIIVALIAEVLR